MAESGLLQRQTALSSAGGMKLPDWGFVDPYQLTLGFLSAAVKKGVKVFERSPITKITFNRKNATAFLDGGAITTENLIICIGEPTSLFKPLKRHLKHEDRYAVLTEPLSAAVRAELGQQAALLTDTESPAHQSVVHRRSPRLVYGRRSEAAPRSPAPADAGPADRPVDVRTDAALSGHFRRCARIWMGRAARAPG